MKLWIVIGLLLSLLCGAAYTYHKYTQNQIEQLIQNNIQLEKNNQTIKLANEVNTNTIEELEAESKRNASNYREASADLQVIRIQNTELRERLSRHELDVLAKGKPELVERIINNASINALRCFELLSGSPLTEKEQNAKTDREFNSECPFLFYERGLE